MQGKHTPGKWIPLQYDQMWCVAIRNERGETNDVFNHHVLLRAADMDSPANVDRVAACVNACEQFEQPAEAIQLLQAEAAKAFPAEQELERLRAVNAELAAALKAVTDQLESAYEGEEMAADAYGVTLNIQQARAALAKAKQS